MKELRAHSPDEIAANRPARCWDGRAGGPRELSSGLLDTPLMMAAITMLSLAGLALYAIIAVAERRTIYWRPPVEVGASGI
jgi:hypothetical protein